MSRATLIITLLSLLSHLIPSIVLAEVARNAEHTNCDEPYPPSAGDDESIDAASDCSGCCQESHHCACCHARQHVTSIIPNLGQGGTFALASELRLGSIDAAAYGLTGFLSSIYRPPIA